MPRSHLQKRQDAERLAKGMALSCAGRPASQIARDLGIASKGSIYQWRKRAGLKPVRVERDEERQHGVELVLAGLTLAEAAAASGVCYGTMKKWMQRFWRHGFDGLAARHRAYHARLDASRIPELVALLAQGAMAHGYVPNRWNSRRVAELVERAFGVNQTPHTTRNILHRHSIPWRSLMALQLMHTEMITTTPLRAEIDQYA